MMQPILVKLHFALEYEDGSKRDVYMDTVVMAKSVEEVRARLGSGRLDSASKRVLARYNQCVDRALVSGKPKRAPKVESQKWSGQVLF